MSERKTTVRGMASMLGITMSRAYQLIRRGDFPTVKEGRSIYILVDLLDDWREQEALRIASKCRANKPLRNMKLCVECKDWLPDIGQEHESKNMPVKMGVCKKHGFRVEIFRRAPKNENILFEK